MTTHTNLHIVRPLTAHEEIYWQLTFNDHIHPVIAAHINGPTKPEQWRRALDAAQARHPMLRVSIEAPEQGDVDFTQPFFRLHADEKIPLRVISSASSPSWEEEMSRELSLPFEFGVAPLARAVLIYSADKSVFLLTGSHSICDGLSLSFVIRDVLQAMAGQRLTELPFPASAEEKLGLTPVAPEHAARDTSAILGPPSALPYVESLQLTEELTEALLTHSRENGTTVHGALAACVVLALRDLEPRFLHDSVRIISPVSTRSILDAADERGMFFTSPKSEFLPNKETTFWDMARAARRDVESASNRESLREGNLAMQQMTGKGLTKAIAADALSTVFGMDVLLTNLGRTPFETNVGGLELESLWPAVLAGRAVQTIGVTTTNGRLALLLTSRQPIPGLLPKLEAIASNHCV